MCVHHVTVTLPHSVRRAGWWPSASARAPISFVNASACAKSGNRSTRRRRSTSSSRTSSHSATCGRSSASSASVTVGPSRRHATQCISGTRSPSGRPFVGVPTSVAPGISFASSRFALDIIGTCYCMHMLEKRLQILLDEARWTAALPAIAAERQPLLSGAVVARGARSDDSRIAGRAARGARGAILSAKPMDVSVAARRSSARARRASRPSRVIVLDTTVLVYAVGDDHELREPARRVVVTAVESGTAQATTTVEAIQEFVHVRARRRGAIRCRRARTRLRHASQPIASAVGGEPRRRPAAVRTRGGGRRVRRGAGLRPRSRRRPTRCVSADRSFACGAVARGRRSTAGQRAYGSLERVARQVAATDVRAPAATLHGS